MAWNCFLNCQLFARKIHRWIPLQIASNPEFWFFCCCVYQSEQVVKQTVNLPMFWVFVTRMWCHCNNNKLIQRSFAFWPCDKIANVYRWMTIWWLSFTVIYEVTACKHNSTLTPELMPSDAYLHWWKWSSTVLAMFSPLEQISGYFLHSIWYLRKLLLLLSCIN